MRKVILFFGLMLLTQTIFAQLSWTKEIHDFGQTQLNVPLAYEFSYLNYTNKNQKIAFVKSSTNGIKPNWDNIVIKTNQTGAFLLNYLPSKQGAFEETIEVHLENNPYPQILTITGFVGNAGTAGYYKPNISGAAPSPKPNKPQLVVPIEETNTPAQPARKPIKITKKPKYQDTNPQPNQPQVAVTKPNQPATTAPVKVTKKPKTKPTKKPKRKPNVKPQRPEKPQAAGNSAGSSLLKTTILPTYVGNATHNTAANAAYFTEREKAMIQEVNLVRSNPKAYVKVVEAHVATMAADKANGDYYKEEIKVGKELIKQLKQTPNLSILYPSQNIYNSAVAHGKEGKQLGDLNHQGKDGRWPWDRITAADKNMQDGNENIVGGMSDVRKSVLTLLIDAGIPDHGHRKTLLEPKWTHIACHEIGDIGGMPNMWLQKFGQAKAGISPNTPSTGSINNNNPKPNRPRIMQKPGSPNMNSAATIAAKVKPTKNNKPQKPGKPVTNQNQTNDDIFDNYTASTTTVNTPVNVESNELSINSLGKNIFPDADCRTAEKAVYMSEREQEMIAEVNLLRTQPQRYAEIIEDYVSFIDAQIRIDPEAQTFYRKELKSAEELIELLDRLKPLNATKPSRNLYKGARIYGEAAKTTGNLERQGSDGSLPWTRIMKYAPTMIDGEENLPYGSTNIRYSIIKLLIDKDDKLRKQRKVLLNPKWNFLAVYEVGKVGNVHYWIQDFGNGSPIAMHDVEKEKTDDQILGFAASSTIETKLLPNIKTPSDNINYKVDYLSEKEKKLLKEINLLRTNPVFYADIINEYIQVLISKKASDAVKANYYQEQIEAAQFIYQELVKIKPLSAIVPNQMLHNAAYNHGKDCQKSGQLQHWGSDGSNTWERLQGAAPGIIDGDQVLVGDATDLREVVILMLVNQVLYNRSRALVLLQPQWTNIAAADVGMVGKRNDCWIITLGKL
jgi:uncharacterized protein YkwD